MELKEVKAKIGSVKNISEITSAMETFSALKMKKTQKRFSESKSFAEEMARVLKNMRKDLKEHKSVFFEERPVKNILVCVVASDRGFCGSFNAGILKFADKEIAKIREEGEVEIMPIGKKAVKHYLKKERIRYSFSGVGDYWEFKQTKEISDFLIKSFLENKYQKVYIFYTHFQSSFIQKPSLAQLFPMEDKTVENFLKKEEEMSGGHSANYLLEPSPAVILDEVIPVFVEYLIYQFILSANTSEHSARMMAMRNASDNARDLLEGLRLAYNKARQQQITSEVCEISSTKEAME
ncbi:MAG TPA: ATP synthase F1 subunit gamma [Candidatus Pacearchaeota archaeon]|nr:ATP synthase F1 subunit gamma [Candidatus Pacearchaeota archaeon]HPR79813.1 ATP synthase F1 subunit gamma [Candidatus Pacearchaeota archaeon]